MKNQASCVARPVQFLFMPYKGDAQKMEIVSGHQIPWANEVKYPNKIMKNTMRHHKNVVLSIQICNLSRKMVIMFCDNHWLIRYGCSLHHRLQKLDD